MNNSMREHWNDVYSSKDVNQLGWYEKTPTPSLELLSKCNATKDMTILDVGTGASTFIDCLIEEGFTNIIATDISEMALSKLRERLGKETASLVRWIVDDITRPIHIQNLEGIDIWHDRAVVVNSIFTRCKRIPNPLNSFLIYHSFLLPSTSPLHQQRP